MQKLISIIGTLIILAAYQNCSQVGFKQENAVQKSSAVNTVGTAFATCADAAARGQMVEKEIDVFFDNPRNLTASAQVCDFGRNGNTPVQNGYMAARFEQKQNLGIPADSVICAADFGFVTQSMSYDDVFFFTLNGAVVATNDDYWSRSFFATDSLALPGRSANVTAPLYDWMKMVGMPNNNHAGQPAGADFCIGAREGLSQCSWPRTQAQGLISMRIDSALITALGTRAPSEDFHVGFITTGDDDPATDCQHEPLSLKMRVRYVAR